MESTTLPASDLNMNKEVESFFVNNQKKKTLPSNRHLKRNIDQRSKLQISDVNVLDNAFLIETKKLINPVQLSICKNSKASLQGKPAKNPKIYQFLKLIQ